MPRAPIDANGLTASTESGAMPFSARRWLSAAPRSAAVSASVPSKSNSAACLVTRAAHQVVDVAVAPQAVLLADRVVGHADQLFGAQTGVAAPAREKS